MEHPKDATRRKNVNQVTFIKNFIAGGVAGAISRTAVSPLERLKILFQVQQDSALLPVKKSNSLKDVFSRILREEGGWGLFKGNGANIIRIIPYSAMQFATNDFILKHFVKNRDQIKTWERLMAGAGAGISAATFTYPLDLVRTRLSLAASSSPIGIVTCLRHAYSNEGGLFALYRGLLPTILGIAPLVAINFTVYEKLKQKSRKLSGRHELSISTRLACGGISGAIAQTFTYPLDVLRRRLQSSRLLGHSYGGMIDAARQIYTQEGWKAFYRGILPNYLKMVPAISISFVIYEAMQQVFNF